MRDVGLCVGLMQGYSLSQLTDMKARNVGPGDKAVAAGGVAGLYLVPGSARGQGKWILRFVSPLTRKRRDMGLGKYPMVGIAAARRAALDAHEIIAQGQDPIAVREVQREGDKHPASIPTFKQAALLVHEELERGFRNRKHAAQWLTTLETYVFTGIGARLVSDLRAADFAEVLKPIWLSKPETASRVRQRCDSVMKWCAAHDHVLASPVGVVTKLLAKQPGKRERVAHHPAVPWRDVPAFVANVLGTGRQSDGKQMLELLILTAARSGEVRGMQWDEVDFARRIWTIPAHRMKARVAHRVPLTDRAVQLLESRRSRDFTALIFATKTGKPLSDMILTKLLRDANVASDTSGRTATAHGFRSAFRDWASENGYPRDLAERALAHTVRDATEAAYHRTDLLELRREMLMLISKNGVVGRMSAFAPSNHGA